MRTSVHDFVPEGERVPAVRVDAVSKRYPRTAFWGLPSKRGDERLALNSVSLKVDPGETVGLLGPNGAGKTTLLKIIATLLSPSSGRVLIQNQDSVRDPVSARRNLGLVTCDERSFYWRISGRQNLEFFAALYGVPKSIARGRIAQLLEVLSLAEAADRPFHSYSSGMKQKLAIARGLLSDPAIVLYDEPTRSLDPLSAHNIRQWLIENRKRSPHTAHLIATNQMQEASTFCDRVLIINRGTVIASGTVEEIQQTWKQREYAVHRLLFRGPSPNGWLHSDPDQGLLDITEESQEDDRYTVIVRTIEESEALSSVMKRVLAAGGTILRCDSEQATFDEVFCALLRADIDRSQPVAVGVRS